MNTKLDEFLDFLPEDLKVYRKKLGNFPFNTYETIIGYDYKEENDMIAVTTEILHLPCLIDKTIERYLGEYLKDSPDPNYKTKYGKGCMVTRFNELHEGWYEDDEPNGHGRLI